MFKIKMQSSPVKSLEASNSSVDDSVSVKSSFLRSNDSSYFGVLTVLLIQSEKKHQGRFLKYNLY